MRNSEISTPAAALIYVVDDAPCLTLWYTLLLEAAGYVARAFNDRAEALAALKADKRKPELLITDYRGLSMPVEPFMQQCLAAHPALRILMASGFSQTDLRFSQAKPDRFIRKPFTPEEFQQEVRAALATAGASEESSHFRGGNGVPRSETPAPKQLFPYTFEHTPTIDDLKK